MNALHNLPHHTPSTRARLAVAALLLSAAATSALAQPQTPPSAPTAPAALPERTRAEVIAELQCARASGELEAAMLRSYGLPPSAHPAVAPSCDTARKDATPRAARP